MSKSYVAHVDHVAFGSSISTPVIEARGLCRQFRRRTGFIRPKVTCVDAVTDVSFDVARGEIFGLLGPNGAGKTTTIKMLNTLLIPTSGTARVAGYDVVHDTREVRRRIGYVFGGDRGLYDRLSGYDNLRYFADLYEIPWRTQRARITELLELVNLSGREHDRVEGYSRGMRQRLHIARGLLAKPSVLFLDEPSLGLDPEGARDLRVAVAALGEAGTTVILTTHYMAEADELCRRIAIIAGGRIVTVDAPGAIKQSTADLRVLEITSRQLPAEVLGIVRTLPGVIDARVEARDHVQLLSVRFAKDVEVQPRVMASLSGVVLDRVSEVTPSLEDAYLTILGRHSEGGEP